ncbi:MULTISPECIES: (2Fe-2S) ferredoxin domain-containing protein [Halanaerobium]|uniref:Thioredoxin-like [2Fe-2S] ferredoxin n=1 Tax=Halanaerobium kushneri TaxID=56779 RepID=A0A1N7AQE0_9FIRM|nr:MULTISPECIES: (2Fe-2S) ferredoxin domain-containing protein [Halanaerobium]RCW54653.1 thioredoxin-like protein [Halanaerobium sp. ST460_2HS_T2]SIR41274.1 Thioredoxin-like [2Fe-2S] ferredoxin [Halanaerobium kushneri]
MVKVEICVGSHCSLVGALNILDTLEELQEEYPEQIEINRVECLDMCGDIKNAPVVKVDDDLITSAQTQMVISKVMERIK